MPVPLVVEQESDALNHRVVGLRRPTEAWRPNAAVSEHILAGWDSLNEDALNAAERDIAPCGDVGLGGAALGHVVDFQAGHDVEHVCGLEVEPTVYRKPRRVAGGSEPAIFSGFWTAIFSGFHSAQVRLLRDDVAVLAYMVQETLTVDGESVTLEAADASTWVRRDGRWLCALHTETPDGDPFGRDRTASPAE